MIVLSALPLAMFVTGPPRSVVTYGLLAGAWTLVLVGAFLPRSPLPAGREGILAIGGILLLALLTALSFSWTDVQAPTVAAAVTTATYAGYLLAAVPALRGRSVARAVEPFALATLSCGAAYGLSERLAPRSIHLSTPEIALGRLTEPLGYWNAVGVASGLALVLAASVAADAERRRSTAILAGATMPLLASALWLSYSRGALAATAAGLVTLIVLRRSVSAVVTVALSLAFTASAALRIEGLDSVKITTGSLRNRSHDGDLLAIFLIAATAVATLAALMLRRSRLFRLDAPRLGRGALRAGAVLAAALALAPLTLVLSGTRQSDRQPAGTNAARLTSVDTDRSEYWRVQIDRFAESPIAGNGGGSFAAAWTQQRGTLRTARNAHSLPIEVAGDLGVLGLAALLMLIAGTALAARHAVRTDRRLAAGPTAALVIFGAHCLIDWDWQVPGLMSVVLVLTAVIVAAADRRGGAKRIGPRILLGAVSAVVIAWSGWVIGGIQHERKARATMRAARMLGWTPDRWTRVQRDLARASQLEPDPAPDVWLILAAVQSRHPEVAEVEARRLVDGNPGSWFAWKLYAGTLRRTDPEGSAAAERRFLELRPTVR